MFKVVPDQLRMSDGWVRCGQCNEVFDANANLYNETDAAAPSPPAAPPVPDPWVESLKFATQKAEATAKQAPQALSDPPLPHTPSEPEPAPVDSFLAQSPRELSRLPEDAPAEPRFEQSKSTGQEAQDGDRLSFMHASAGSGFWQRPGVRLVLAVAAVVLLAVLCLQFLVQERDRMAASSSTAKQFFTTACSVFGCKVSPLRQIDSVVIDSSSFTKVRGDVYRLSFTLKNSGLVEVATPAIEITLTDLQDQPVIRRVLQYSEFGSKSETMAAGSELSAVLPVSAKMPGTERIAGYRLLAFYP